jgi:hypothetical protein
MTTTIAALAIVLMTSAAHAAQPGYEFYQSCTASRNSPYYFQEIAYCQGFLDGVFQESGGYCPPGPVQTGALIMIVTNYMQTHPQDLPMQSGAVVLRAYTTAWPCQNITR